MFRKRQQFNPLKICVEILTIQLCFYICYVLIAVSFDSIFKVRFSPSQLFDSTVFKIGTRAGKIAIGSMITSSLFGALVFVAIEGRHRRALDFMSTMMVIHVLICSIEYHFPSGAWWWVTCIASWILSTPFAELLSMKQELRDINLEGIL